MTVNPTIQTILSRKSVRHFTQEPVSREDIELILRAGMAAPSGVNAQPWAFLVIDDRKILDTLAEKLPYAKMQREAPIGILVCGDMQKALPAPHQDLWPQDCAAATENILLAIESLGLGAVWTWAHGSESNVQIIRDVVSLPDNIEPFAYIPVGHPSGECRPKDKFDASRIHWNRF